MHAIVRLKYGTPDVREYKEIERPDPADEDALVQVHAAGASIGDYIMVIRVQAIGAKVTTFRPGDEIFGESVTGAFAEYLVVPATLIAPKPTNLSLEESAAVPWAALTGADGYADRKLEIRNSQSRAAIPCMPGKRIGLPLT